MLLGVGLCALGVVITIGTFSVASLEGGYYVITYGLIISGAGDFLYGLVGWLSELRNNA